MSNTTNLDLERPDKGDTDWHTSLNSNMTKLDTGYGNNVASIADLPEVYIETGTFNYLTGHTITLPKSVDSINEYNVSVIATTRAGAIGDIWVSKTTSEFAVKCSENNTADTFAAVIYYIGDIASYGGSIYRKWYVSPDASITDHGDDTDTGSLAWVLDQVGATAATVELPGNKTYVISTTVTVGSNIALIFQNAAVLKDDASNAVLTINGSIDAGSYQQIFDWGNGSGDLTLGSKTAGVLYPEWWGVDGTADDVQIGLALAAGSTSKIPVRLIQDSYTIGATFNIPVNSHLYSLSKSILTAKNSLDDEIATITGSYISIKGIVFDGNSSNQAAGAAIIDATDAGSFADIKILDCKFDDTYARGIRLNCSLDGLRIENCEFTNIGTDAISHEWSTSETANNLNYINNYMDTGVDGIFMYNATTVVPTNISIVGNTIKDFTENPIEINIADGVETLNIEGNKIYGDGLRGIGWKGSDVHVTNNLIKDQEYYGMQAGAGDLVIISENTVEDCAYGIEGEGTGIISNISITNNVFSGNQGVGGASAGVNNDHIRIPNLQTAIISGNSFYNPWYKCITIYQSTENPKDVTVTNNTFLIDSVGGTIPQAVALYQCETGLIANNQFTLKVDYGATNVGLVTVAYGSEDISIKDNSFVSTVVSQQAGIALTDVGLAINRVTITGNNFRNLNYGVYSTAVSSYVLIKNNEFYDITTADIQEAGAYITAFKKATTPTAGGWYKVGDVVWETAPTDSNPPGWICSTRVKTEMRAAAVVTATTMEVDSTTGMATGDICGVELDNGAWHWTTATVTDGDTLELAAGLSGDGAAINNDVICMKWLPLAELGTVKV